ncbi:MAG TPA: DUF58 domain-containing protein [Povalibacter sp.]|uniref:DUF58 domain-containing protein n=1 Tax=Povalibacter sp. TaxID=1962978 RepID=UPI002C8D90A9|nr:DUF58 domain-containing protein [Povalibacter sp.]HMN46151.1 DUF58 domain-containing protein [Povalibacter sp.]
MNATRHLLSPETLASLANLELVARTAVHGFLTGLHRSPHFGFSQEFREYRAYAEGDDPRFVDWNVYARTDRTYIRRYEGETNTRLMILLDASASMGYASRTGAVSKLQYAKFVAAALAYLAARQHDPVGLIVFDDKLREVRPARSGNLQAVIHTVDQVTAGGGTDLDASFAGFREHLTRRSLVALISDLYCKPETMTRVVQPLTAQGHDVMIFQVLDPQELQPQWDESVVLEDLETQTHLNVSPEFLQRRYRQRLQEHLDGLRSVAAATGAHYALLPSDQPLNDALRRYLLLRQRRS